jgi:geranylgeranyl pyrophosphate synthase
LLDAWLSDSRTWAESALARCLDSADIGPPRLAEALRYAVFGDGKRVRPALVRLACNAHGGSDAAAAPSAVAVELVHAYSLVHDDLPCMDDDDLRRGRPTVHVAYDEATAVLVGDGLQALAFGHLAQHGGPRAAEAIVLLAAAAGPAGMVGGQALDLAAEGQPIDAAGARAIHLGKTAALLGASAELGALAGGAGVAARAAARAFGVQLGLLFQAVDDVLDVTGDAATLGKTPGKDVAGGKGTVVAALGLDGARRAAQDLATSALEAGRAAGLDREGLVTGFVARMLARTS